jgi:hypothetical protein
VSPSGSSATNFSAAFLLSALSRRCTIECCFVSNCPCLEALPKGALQTIDCGTSSGRVRQQTFFAARNGLLDVFVTCGNDDRIA